MNTIFMVRLKFGVQGFKVLVKTKAIIELFGYNKLGFSILYSFHESVFSVSIKLYTNTLNMEV